MEPLFEAPPTTGEPGSPSSDDGQGASTPSWLIIVFGGLAGLTAGLPFGLGTGKLPALTGLLLIGLSLMLGARTRRPIGGAIAMAAFFGALLGVAGGFVWQTQQRNEVHRDTSRDPVFAAQGRITRATIGSASTDEEWDKGGPKSIRYCHRISFLVEQEDGQLDITAQRCDLSQALWTFLDGRQNGGIDIIYIQAELQEMQLAPGSHTLSDLDYRYDQELPEGALKGLRERCTDPKDYACQIPGDR